LILGKTNIDAFCIQQNFFALFNLVSFFLESAPDKDYMPKPQVLNKQHLTVNKPKALLPLSFTTG
jgi:hypothetical protein